MKRILALLLLLAACTPRAITSTPSVQLAAPTATATAIAVAAVTRFPTHAASLAPTLTPLPTEPAPKAVTITPAPTFTITRTSAIYGEIHLSETRLGSAAGYTLKEGDPRNDEFYSRIPPEILVWPKRDLSSFQPENVEPLGEVIQRFGYRLEGTASPFTLYKGDQALSQNITNIGRYALNGSKTDFFLLLTVDFSQAWLLQKERFELYFDGKPRVEPIFLGDRLLLADFKTTDEGIFGVVKTGEQVLYTSPKTALGPETCPIDFFRAWGEHWVMQIDGQVVLDGHPLGADLGYQKAFNWRLIQEKPVYLFQKGDRYGVSYDGEEIPVQYDQIAQTGCVVGALTYPFGAWGVDGHVRFFAQRGGDWYMVEVEG